MHLHHGAMHLHMTNQEATVDDLFINDFTWEVPGDHRPLQFVLSINVFSFRQMMRLAGGKIASFPDKKQWRKVLQRNWDGCQIGERVLLKSTSRTRPLPLTSLCYIVSQPTSPWKRTRRRVPSPRQEVKQGNDCHSPNCHPGSQVSRPMPSTK